MKNRKHDKLVAALECDLVDSTAEVILDGRPEGVLPNDWLAMCAEAFLHVGLQLTYENLHGRQPEDLVETRKLAEKLIGDAAQRLRVASSVSGLRDDDSESTHAAMTPTHLGS